MLMPCLGIIFQRVTDKKITGHKLFQSFVQENKACFWNTSLVEAINSTKYVGYIKPSTLFITSMNERYMQMLRDAWIRQILKPAKGYRIETLGDVQNIGMHKIDQIHLMPLLDIICNLVSKMNQNGRPATLAALQDEIRREYPKIEPPSTKTFRQAIQTLLKQKILEYDLEQLYICFPPTTPYHSNKTPPKCTAECQTGRSIMNGYVPSNSLKIKKGFLARLFMKKSNLPKTAQLNCNPRDPSGQWNLQLPIASVQSNRSDEISPAAQKIYLPDGNEFCRRWIKMNDQGLPNNCSPVGPPEYFPCLTNYRSINCKIRQKRRPRMKMKEHGQTLTPVQRSSDSAFSLSPVITGISNGFCNSKFGDISPEEPIIVNVNQNHTYVNMLSSESTQFEDITQVGKILPTTLSITNV